MVSLYAGRSLGAATAWWLRGCANHGVFNICDLGFRVILLMDEILHHLKSLKS